MQALFLLACSHYLIQSLKFSFRKYCIAHEDFSSNGFAYQKQKWMGGRILTKKKKKKLYCLEEDFERIYISVTLCFCIQVLNLRRSDVMKV